MHFYPSAESAYENSCSSHILPYDFSCKLYVATLAVDTDDPTVFENDAEPSNWHDPPEARQADSVFKVNGDSIKPKYGRGLCSYAANPG